MFDSSLIFDDWSLLVPSDGWPVDLDIDLTYLLRWCGAADTAAAAGRDADTRRKCRYESRTRFAVLLLNPLECRGNYTATSNNTKLVHWPLMGWLLHLVQWGGDWAGPQSASVPLTAVLLLLCSCNERVKGFIRTIPGFITHTYNSFYLLFMYEVLW